MCLLILGLLLIRVLTLSFQVVTCIKKVVHDEKTNDEELFEQVSVIDSTVVKEPQAHHPLDEIATKE